MSVDDDQGRGDKPGPISGPDTEKPGEVRLDRLVHELRSPLAAIQSMADALSSGHLGRIENERHVSYVQSIAETAKHALAVIEGMLLRGRPVTPADARSGAGVDVEALAREVVAGMAMLAARAGVRLDMRESTEPAVRAMVCATDLRQMLINLVSNGIVHAGGGTTVRIEAGSLDGMVWVAVSDNGPGIVKSVIERLEMGLPLDPVVEGSPASRMRLGLTLTRALARANGGHLELRTNGGTEARILLPAAL